MRRSASEAAVAPPIAHQHLRHPRGGRRGSCRHSSCRCPCGRARHRTAPSRRPAPASRSAERTPRSSRSMLMPAGSPASTEVRSRNISLRPFRPCSLIWSIAASPVSHRQSASAAHSGGRNRPSSEHVPGSCIGQSSASASSGSRGGTALAHAAHAAAEEQCGEAIGEEQDRRQREGIGCQRHGRNRRQGAAGSRLREVLRWVSAHRRCA